MSTIPATTAAEIPPEWIEVVGSTLARQGVACRAGAGLTLEIQSPNDRLFRPVMLPKGGTTFTTAEDRDSVLRQLHTRSNKHDLTT